MGTVLVHLSDIHLSIIKANNPIIERANSVAGIIRTVLSPSDKCIVVISGDIANCGKEEEYVLAAEFIEELQKHLREHCCNETTTVLVPGNHDLDFEVNDCDEGIRSIIIDKITPNDPPTEKMITYCEMPLANYNKFAETVGKSSVMYTVTGLIDSYSL